MSSKVTTETFFYIGFDRLSLCVFELIYFANPLSIIDSISIQDIRERFGRELARVEKYLPTLDKNLDNNQDTFCVIGVPKSGVPSAKEYASYLDLPYEFLALGVSFSNIGLI